ncbi:hypothetical protein BJ170DRAFT_590300 [Xylariales sp. AK1849]|nr:hypothetical protein BJ170DRAFT_590300 [Xylariales sp. AK1849]
MFMLNRVSPWSVPHGRPEQNRRCQRFKCRGHEHDRIRPGLDPRKGRGRVQSKAWQPKSYTRQHHGEPSYSHIQWHSKRRWIGKAYITFGAVTDPKGKTPFASYLAGIVGDPDKEAGVAGNSSYTVSCAVDPRNVFEYRSVILNLHALGDNKASNMAQYLSGTGPCTPVNPAIGDKLFVTAGTAGHFLVNEYQGIYGYFATIARVAGYERNSSFAFPDSSNCLEDVLGVVLALAVS